jgi:hypothetical protein
VGPPVPANTRVDAWFGIGRTGYDTTMADSERSEKKKAPFAATFLLVILLGLLVMLVIGMVVL